MAEYIWVVFFMGIGLVFAGGALITNWLLKTSKPNEERLSPYECGEKPIGTSWIQYDIKYYLYGLIFIIFEVEVVFIIPWAVIFSSSGIAPVVLFVEMMIFIGILLIGLIYVWKIGALAWE